MNEQEGTNQEKGSGSFERPPSSTFILGERVLLDKPEVAALGARMEDYFTPSTPWTRQLWRLSTLGEVGELLETWELHRQGALSESSVKYLTDGLVRRVKADSGIGSTRDRGILVGHLQRKLLPGSHDAHALSELLAGYTPAYLDNWASATRSHPPSIETLSRALCSHMLDAGFSRTSLTRWLHYHKRKNNSEIHDVPGLITLGQKLLHRRSVRHEIIVPLRAAPPLISGGGSCWLTPTETSRWFDDWFPGTSLRQAGALRVECDARDLGSALGVAQAEMSRMQSRFRVGGRKNLEFFDHAYSIGEPEPILLRQAPRRVQVHALEDTRAIFDRELPGQLDAVLELLEPLDRGPSAAAVTGAWAALEAMFVGPGDTSNRVVAATRTARILTCAYILSELRTLAAAYECSQDDALAHALRRESNENRKAQMVESALASGKVMHFASPRHHAALLRMHHLIADRAGFLQRVCGQLEDVFRRLYRQRNLIVHAGQLTSCALRATLRTAAPLVGAGVDTAVRAAVLDGIPPLELAAKSEIRLAAVSAGQRPLAGLLSSDYVLID